MSLKKVMSSGYVITVSFRSIIPLVAMPGLVAGRWMGAGAGDGEVTLPLIIEPASMVSFRSMSYFRVMVFESWLMYSSIPRPLVPNMPNSSSRRTCPDTSGRPKLGSASPRTWMGFFAMSVNSSRPQDENIAAPAKMSREGIIFFIILYIVFGFVIRLSINVLHRFRRCFQ